jgi:hypothetical protein
MENPHHHTKGPRCVIPYMFTSFYHVWLLGNPTPNLHPSMKNISQVASPLPFLVDPGLSGAGTKRSAVVFLGIRIIPDSFKDIYNVPPPQL